MRGFSLRYAPALMLAIHLATRIWLPNPQVFLDLILFNSIAIALVVGLVRNRFFTDFVGMVSLSLAIALWTLGSIISTYSEFFPHHSINSNYANACYMAMYPLAFIGLHRATQGGKQIRSVEILDGAILGIGLSAVGSAFFIAPILPHFHGNAVETFFAILFPIADLVLVALVLTLSLLSPYSIRTLLLCTGVIIFAIADFVFLSMRIQGTYTLGGASDDLWLLGLVLLVESLHHQGPKRAKADFLHPLYVVLAVMMSATLLAVTSLRPNYLPNFVVIPAIATLLLAFVRMTIALKEASSIGEERLLARTDDLTGLPNRRKFLADLADLNEEPTSTSALLLMDLDGFKPINDLYGHEIGDKLLREVSKRFSRAIPQGSILARLGGDEFGAIICGEKESTFEVALALRATLSYPFIIVDREISIDVSIGHVMNDGGANLLRRADLAMYQAKRNGVGVWAEQR